MDTIDDLIIAEFKARAENAERERDEALKHLDLVIAGYKVYSEYRSKGPSVGRLLISAARVASYWRDHSKAQVGGKL
jgi:hypothetical protein